MTSAHTSMPAILVLAGGPDAEHDVSIAGGNAVADALQKTERFRVHREAVEKLTAAQLKTLCKEVDVVFPVLHGPFGEGGPLQRMLTDLRIAYVGSPPSAARLAMDKIATKAIALAIGVPTATACAMNPKDTECPLPLPVVVKPIHEGSTIGLHVCHSEDDYLRAHKAACKERRPYMIEPCIKGRELTVSVLDGWALPIIEITPATGIYDYEAKYERDDTTYTINPPLPPQTAQRLAQDAVRLCNTLGVRHLARVDFILDQAQQPWLLEANTMPGFTDHSLLPMAARAIPGSPLSMSALCARLVELALHDAASLRTHERAHAYTPSGDVSI